MKHIAFSALVLAFVLPANAEICRSVATVWQEAGYTHRTEISTRADNGCKRLTQSIDGLEETGNDCNCDLVIDGREGHFRAPDAYGATSLLAICHGPDADPSSYPREGSWIEVVED